MTTRFYPNSTSVPRQVWGPAAWVLAASLLSGCGALQGAKNLTRAAVYPTVEDLKITTQADLSINPDDKGGSLPVTVRVYQLGDRNQIGRVDYSQLVDHDKDVLGASLIQRYEYVAYPESTSVNNFPIRPGTRYIAVLAVMRNAPSPIYYLLDSTDIGSGGITLQVGATGMVLTSGPAPLNKAGDGGQGAGAPHAKPKIASVPALVPRTPLSGAPPMVAPVSPAAARVAAALGA